MNKQDLVEIKLKSTGTINLLGTIKHLLTTNPNPDVFLIHADINRQRIELINKTGLKTKTIRLSEIKAAIRKARNLAKKTMKTTEINIKYKLNQNAATSICWLCQNRQEPTTWNNKASCSITGHITLEKVNECSAFTGKNQKQAA